MFECKSCGRGTSLNVGEYIDGLCFDCWRCSKCKKGGSNGGFGAYPSKHSHVCHHCWRCHKCGKKKGPYPNKDNLTCRDCWACQRCGKGTIDGVLSEDKTALCKKCYKIAFDEIDILFPIDFNELRNLTI